MKKMIGVNSPTGTNDYKLVSAFDSYIVLDSAKKDANGFTIVYVSKIENDTTLLYVEGEEWELAKKNLIAAVKGDGVNWIEPNDSYEASENVGHQISLKDDNLQALIKNYEDAIGEVEEEKIQNGFDIPVINGATPVEEEKTVENQAQNELNTSGVNETVEEQVQNELDTPVVNEPVEEIKEEIPVNNLEDSIANVDMTSPIDIISSEEAPVQENESEVGDNMGSPTVPAAEEQIGLQPITDQPSNDSTNVMPVSEYPTIGDAPSETMGQTAIPAEQPMQAVTPEQNAGSGVPTQGVVPTVEPVTFEQSEQPVVPGQAAFTEQNITSEVPTQDVVQAVQPVVEQPMQAAIPGQPVVPEQNITSEIPTQDVVQAVQPVAFGQSEQAAMPGQNVTAEFQAQGVATTEQNVGLGVSTQNVASAVQPVIQNDNIQNNTQEFQENMNQLVSTINLVNNLYTMIQEQQQRLNEKEQELNEKERKLNEEQKNVEALKQSLMIAKQQNEQAMAYNQQMNRQATPQQVQGQVRALQA